MCATKGVWGVISRGGNVNERGLGLREGSGWPSGVRRGDSKTHLFEIWRTPFCPTGSRLMTIRGIRGLKTLRPMCICVCAYKLPMSVCLCCRQNMKDGNIARRGGGGC